MILKKKLRKNESSIMIIGVGAIGKRHLQSLIKIKGRVHLYLVDPILNFKKNNELYKFLGIGKIKSNKKIFIYKKIEDWTNKDFVLDLCIIATTSDVRFSIFNKVMNFVSTKNILLEKFLFNKINDYYKALKICSKKQITIYVNQWMRESLKLRKILSKYRSNKLDFKVSGVEWGMACNIMHFVDLVRHFKVKNSYVPYVRKANLSPMIRNARRNKFFEIYGDIEIKYGSHNLYISCTESKFATGSAPDGIDVEIKARDHKKKLIKLNLKPGLVKGVENIDGNVRYFTSKIELMSELSSKIFINLKNYRKVYLPSLNNSINQHLPICKLFSKHFEKNIKTKKGLCPVT